MLETNPTAKSLILGNLALLRKLGVISQKEYRYLSESISGFNEGEYLKKNRASEYLGVSTGSIDNYVNSGKLKAYRLNKSLRFKRSDLDQLLEVINGENYK